MVRLVSAPALLLLGVLPLAGQSPLQLDPATIDFGAPAQHQVLSAEVTLTNITAAPLHLTHVHADCGCTVPELERTTLEVGRSTTLQVRFETREFLGLTQRRVTIETDHGTVTLPILADIHPYADWRIAPLPATVPPTRTGETATLTLTLQHHGPSPARPLDAVADQPWLDAKLIATDTPSLTLLHLQKSAGAPTGDNHATITVQTDSATTPELTFDVTVPVRSAVQVDPHPIVLPRVPVGTTSTGTFAVRDWPADAPPPRVTTGRGKVEALGFRDGAWHFELSVTPDSVGARFFPVRIYRGDQLELDVNAVVRAHARPE